eukprot:1292610-Rhodomonas_salina.1
MSMLRYPCTRVPGYKRIPAGPRRNPGGLQKKIQFLKSSTILPSTLARKYPSPAISVGSRTAKISGPQTFLDSSLLQKMAQIRERCRWEESFWTFSDQRSASIAGASHGRLGPGS